MSHIWHAQSIFRREDGAIVETKEGHPFSSNHAEAFVDVRLASDYEALRAEVERERGVSMEYVEQRNEALVRAERAEAEVERLKAEIRDARGLMRGMIDAKDGRVARFLIERAERFIQRTADPTLVQ